jgi:hypothetical protein
MFDMSHVENVWFEIFLFQAIYLKLSELLMRFCSGFAGNRTWHFKFNSR